MVGRAWWSVPTVEMCEVLSAGGIDVKGFMLEMASSDSDASTSLARGRP